MSASKFEAAHDGSNGDAKDSSKSKTGRSFILVLFAGIYAALTSCMAKASVSMEGNLDRESVQVSVNIVI